MMSNPVEQAHPFSIVPCGCGCGRGLPIWRRRTAEDYEDIDALPPEEQAAILCSLSACNAATVPMAPYGSPVDYIVRAAYFGVPCLCDPRHSMNAEGVRDEWAEAEARIRCGKVRR